jgi:hypothetical protein
VGATATAADRRSSRFERLGPWIGLPLLGLLLTGLLFGLTPEAPCETPESIDAWAWTLFVWGIALSVVCLAGATVRVVRLARGKGISRRQSLLALVIVVVLAAIAAVVPIGAEPVVYWRVWAVAVPATGLALLALTVAALLRRRADDVGLLLPAYLAGAGLFVFPSLALFTAVIKSNAFCS